MEKIEVSAIFGPTASGKSDLAMEIALKNNGEIVSIDSIQIYKEMDIGSAKPDKKMQNDVKHHMIDIIEPNQKMDARSFALLARAAIKDIASRGKHPVLAGGSGLYFDALYYDFFDCPPSDPVFRDMMNKKWEIDEGESLHKKLESIDPVSASRINKKNKPRLVRALEVFELTGRTFSSTDNSKKRVDWLKTVNSIYVNPDRNILYDRINTRTEKMMQSGWFSEVNYLLVKYGASAKGMGAVGYKEVSEYLSVTRGHGLSEADLVKIIQQNTRRLAKRQITWFSKYGNYF
ncbi:MAG: tRNA (adenosine(37)-N6)-dimethylallyltransferase MiaA [Fibrobacteres bacterium]|nr:tRNA (adenosine(37)-N6)-dimethylallyltransferase MiaA [Fibrobacterota bacterium]